MKKMQMIIVACALLIGATTWGSLHAANFDDAPQRMMGHRSHRGGGGPNLLGRYLHENMMVEVLCQLTEQTPETVKQQLKEEHLPAVLNEYKIDRERFHAAMQAKKTAQINQFVADGYLSSDQGKAILGKMEARTRRHELMMQLVEKGVADGAITQQDAQLLLPPHH
ncbi:MAG: hypothetical protein WCA08_23790 [Desulfoferrobacter sp.]